MTILTPQERRIVLFIIGVWLAGICVRWLVLVRPACSVYLGAQTLKLPLNTASYNDLVESRLVPPSLARKIVEYRQENGDFKVLDDLKKIKGIKERRFIKLKDVFYVP